MSIFKILVADTINQKAKQNDAQELSRYLYGTGLLLRNLIYVTIIRKPYYLL